MIIREIPEKSFLQMFAPEKMQQAVSAVKDDVKSLAIKGSAADVALGVLVGAAVTPLAISFVEDLVVPPMALLFGGKELRSMHWVIKDGPTPGSYKTAAEAKKDGAVIVRYGAFVQSSINCAVLLFTTYGLLRLLKTIRDEGGIWEFVKKKRSAASSAASFAVGKITS